MKTEEQHNLLTPKIAAFMSDLKFTLHMVSARHRDAAGQLATWIVERLDATGEANVIVVCTGNSRRSMLGSVLGNIAASYHQLKHVRFFSGGSEPSAFNPRTVRALTEVGIGISMMEQPLLDDELATPNPIYRVGWGSGEILDFSKMFSDEGNPSEGFAAFLVCSEAAGACPSVAGASIRIPCPFVDPKEADGTPHERRRYSDARDEIGRVMLFVTQEVAARTRTGVQPLV